MKSRSCVKNKELQGIKRNFESVKKDFERKMSATGRYGMQKVKPSKPG